ncbi:immunoglobulin lambda-1 light chain-like [Tamandua tetradactyla]|uniref:immunoglobulin lambda-1 light chain-like n=1 Tax=Tamandua tetradactyla TaxID=48850 RepID=UPI0040548771
MSWVPVLLLLLTCCTGAHLQPVLQQPPSVSAPLGTTVSLACTLSRDSSISLHGVYWYQLRPGHPPRLLLKYPPPSDMDRGPEVPPRFSGSRDVASNTGYLSISELQPEDEAVYFCQTWDDHPTWYVFGGGTQLTVLGQPKASPSVHVFPPSPEELATNHATLVCLISGFYPGSVDVTWKRGGNAISQGVQTSRPSKQADSRYAASSYLSLDSAQWRRGDTYSCQVTHEGSMVEKSVAAGQCP